MKSLSVILLCSVVFLCLVQVGAALTYEGTLEYSNDHNHATDAIQPGDVIMVSGIIRLPASGTQTFDMVDSLEFYTQLEKAKWSFSIVIDGKDNPYLPYGTVKKIILGNDLAYPSETEVKVKFSMTEGMVPSNFSSGDIILARALELDDRSEKVGTGVYKNGTVFNPATLQTQLDIVKAKLADLKNAITEKSNMNVDVTAAQAKYQAASDALDTATTKITSSPSEVNNLLTTATNNINDASVALDQAWAEQSLLRAKAMIDSVDGLIKEFTVNRSLKLSDSRLVPITNKFDLAVKSKNDAQNLFDQGTYNIARSDANQALGYANDAWNLSLSLKDELDKGFSLPLPNLGAFLPFLVVIVVVLIIAGVIIYRKKTQWDELG